MEAARIRTATGCSRCSWRRGLDAHPHDEVGIAVYCTDERVGDEVYAYVEAVIMDIGASFVPIKHEGVIYMRPPLAKRARFSQEMLCSAERTAAKPPSSYLTKAGTR